MTSRGILGGGRAILVVLLAASPARASSTTDEWLGGLTDKVIADLTAGKPLVVEVHVPLCDNELTRCGNAKLGDGDNPSTNLYWSTTPGLGVWFARKGSGWKRVVHLTSDTGDKDVLELHVYRRTVTASRAWREKGAPRTLEVDVVIHGWRGRALDSALRYATERKAFGEPIANFQLIQQMLAESETEIYAAECMMTDVTARADRGENILRKAAAFKVFASEMCGRVVDRVVQIYGGAGYLAEYDAERFFRDARIYRIYEGTTQILQLQIAKHMLRDFEAGL